MFRSSRGVGAEVFKQETGAEMESHNVTPFISSLYAADHWHLSFSLEHQFM